MNDNNLRKSLVEALSWASIRELPQKDLGESVWIKALALVTKRDGSKSYVALRRTVPTEYNIIKDFGSDSIITIIEEIYPYLFLDGTFIPEFKTQKKDDRIKWLSMNGVDDNLEELTLKELNKKIVEVAIKNQLRA